MFSHSFTVTEQSCDVCPVPVPAGIALVEKMDGWMDDQDKSGRGSPATPDHTSLLSTHYMRKK